MLGGLLDFLSGGFRRSTSRRARAACPSAMKNWPGSQSRQLLDYLELDFQPSRRLPGGHWRRRARRPAADLSPRDGNSPVKSAPFRPRIGKAAKATGAAAVALLQSSRKEDSH
ncbi:hypothetical protein SJA_C2-04390 [Sphingobium indicum UT26S]|uniref:Uncharacterized protein n=1 Tax=Sphingobium indicum (strain DSM 16413 / CCM 7287 / MTCC 6362 / UT26 / NBRC 101211 / UT26S) TaxID=452662 RepID=D4Z8I3_SPHIU|nr:hypothetical protein SJA_C2-04390 [Sphingobium indicum UT26S]